MKVLVALAAGLSLASAGCNAILGVTDPKESPEDGGVRVQTGIAVAPDPLMLALDGNQQLRLFATFSDSTSDELIEPPATWTLTSGDAITLSPTGFVAAQLAGTAKVTASLDGFSDDLDVTVLPSAADSLELSFTGLPDLSPPQGAITIAQQQRMRLHVVLVLADTTRQDVTASATWTTDAPAVATGSAGQIDALVQSGSAKLTATASGVSASLDVVVSDQQCHPTINEVQAGGVNGATAVPGDEWAEIINPCTVAIDVNNWSLVYRAATATGATDTILLATLTNQLMPGEIKLFAGGGFTGTADNDPLWPPTTGQLQATNGSIGLRNGPRDTGLLIDAMAYGALNAGHPFVDPGTAPSAALANGMSSARRPFDGIDSNNSSTDFTVVATPTPRAANVP